MILKCLSTGSKANCYILTSESGKHLILDAGVTVPEIKKGLNFDIANVEGCLVTHEHKDHSLSADKIANFSPVWKPYESEQKKLHTHLGEFDITSFDVPHNGVENRGFLIGVDEQMILYVTDFEYIPYNLASKNIDTMLIELNYQAENIEDNPNNHMSHVILGHAEEKVTIEILRQNTKSLRSVILCHMSNSGNLNRELAMKNIKDVLPNYVQVSWAKAGQTYNISRVPF